MRALVFARLIMLLAIFSCPSYVLGQEAKVPAPESTNSLRGRAEKGNADAQFSLGTMYGKGQGVPQNYAEAARWYAEVLGAQPVRMLKDRVTFSLGGVLQLVCHLERRAVEHNPRAYPRHHGLTFLRMEDFSRLKDHLEKLGAKFLQRPAVRFANSTHEHQTFMLVDPSGNVVEFKCYTQPEFSY